MKVIWNKKENRPAFGSEIRELEKSGDLYFNYYMEDVNTGLVWIELSAIAKKDFELRELE